MADADLPVLAQDSDSDDLRSQADDRSGELPMAPVGFQLRRSRLS